jgi:hypothetical protein
MVEGSFEREREREREVLKLGLPESSFVCFFAFSGRKSNKGQYVVTYF